MILSTSRRTDIPAFFSDWFYKRIEEGFFMVRNPMNVHQVSKISVSPQNVECFVFWTKNPSDDFISNLKRLDNLGYKYYFQFTITSYAQDIEKNVVVQKALMWAHITPVCITAHIATPSITIISRRKQNKILPAHCCVRNLLPMTKLLTGKC